MSTQILSVVLLASTIVSRICHGAEVPHLRPVQPRIPFPRVTARCMRCSAAWPWPRPRRCPRIITRSGRRRKCGASANWLVILRILNILLLTGGRRNEIQRRRGEEQNQQSGIGGRAEGSGHVLQRHICRHADAKGGEMVKLMNADFARLAVLAANIAHDYEHYGNMATYMRIKGIVSPSSKRAPNPARSKRLVPSIFPAPRRPRRPLAQPMSSSTAATQPAGKRHVGTGLAVSSASTGRKISG